MRPSKLRVPLSTEQTARSASLTAAEISSGSGPEFPMQVVQPEPTRLKPSSSSGSVRPARSRYSVTTFEPGASDVLTHGCCVRPFATALRASRPAPSITLGFDVFVHDVIAAMTTWPWSTLNVSPFIETSTALSECSATTVPAATAGAVLGRLGESSWPGAPFATGSDAGNV